MITGNWGSDLALLIKASKDAGVTANYYTYYAPTTGVPTAMGAAGAGHVKYVGYFGPNTKGNPPQADQIFDGFKKKYDDDFFDDGGLYRHRDAEPGVQGNANRPIRSRWPRRLRA